MLGADGQTNGVGMDIRGLQFLRAQLRVRRGGRVDDQALHVRHIGQQREDLQRVNESMGLLHAALDIEGENGGAAVGEVLLKQRVIRMIGQRGVVDLLHLRVPGEKLHHLFGVLCVAVEAQGEGLHALQQQKGVEGRNAGAGVTKNNSPEIGNEGSGAGRVTKEMP